MKVLTTIPVDQQTQTIQETILELVEIVAVEDQAGRNQETEIEGS
ncbi:hypothetical protein HMPREF9413_1417 [Paenibacillus sp. HGF7]|nr:hypothetical protein HMPREF9413_1417 [Paenibacillus sp. HGF7]